MPGAYGCSQPASGGPAGPCAGNSLKVRKDLGLGIETPWLYAGIHHYLCELGDAVTSLGLSFLSSKNQGAREWMGWSTSALSPLILQSSQEKAGDGAPCWTNPLRVTNAPRLSRLKGDWEGFSGSKPWTIYPGTSGPTSSLSTGPQKPIHKGRTGPDQFQFP